MDWLAETEKRMVPPAKKAKKTKKKLISFMSFTDSLHEVIGARSGEVSDY